MASSKFANMLAFTTALIVSSNISLGQSILPDKDKTPEPVRRTYQPRNKENPYSLQLIEPNSLANENPFTSRPDLRPTEPMKVFQNRLGESLSLAYSYHGTVSQVQSPGFLTRDFYDNRFLPDMQRATERGFERTARVFFTDPLERSITRSSWFSDIESKFVRGFSGWENDTLPDPTDPVKEGLPGQREVYMKRGLDGGAHLARRNPFLFMNFKNQNASFSTRLSAGSITDPETYSNPTPILSFIAQLPLTRNVPLDFSVNTSYNSSRVGEKFPVSTYIGTHFEFKKGELVIGTSPQSGSGFISYNLSFK
ncbi:MAG: hypothetical protein Q7R87_02985 [Nanoarchaeota archaeon]|nr:hypothetical protein [Nanoarchaeota archaeon]